MSSQNVSDKIYIREGNSLDCKLKSLNIYLVYEELICVDHSGCRLGSSHHLKKA